jgi:hypothetical protein
MQEIAAAIQEGAAYLPRSNTSSRPRRRRHLRDVGVLSLARGGRLPARRVVLSAVFINTLGPGARNVRTAQPPPGQGGDGLSMVPAPDGMLSQASPCSVSASLPAHLPRVRTDQRTMVDLSCAGFGAPGSRSSPVSVAASSLKGADVGGDWPVRWKPASLRIIRQPENHRRQRRRQRR